MSFRPDETNNFLELFAEIKEKVRHFEGCQHLELLEDYDDPNSFTTYSKWQDKEALAAYRQSDLFAAVWIKTKVLFAKKPIAFSLKMHTKVD
jgi:quinol monooxygenase YgiN